MSRPKPKIFARGVDKMTRAEWLELRRKGIGGSDAAAIAGLNPWRGPLSVYLSKIGASPETDTNEAMEWGIELEDVIARKFSQRKGFPIKRCNMILQHPEHDFMLANIDRYTKDPDEEAWGVLEIKNVGEYRAEDWADGAIPEYYQVQGMHYMAVTGAQYVWFAPLIGGNRLQPVKLLRSERGIRSLIKIEREFWKLVESRTPPPLDDSEEASKVLKAIYPQSKSTTVFIDSELVEQLHLARERRAEAEREVRGLENKIKELMGEAEAALISGNPKPVVTWKGSSVHTLDVEAIKQAEPELCMKYMRETSMRRFLVK